MSRARRFLGPLVIAGLLLPVAVIPLRPLRAVSAVENRTLAGLPHWPRTRADWRALPRQVDSFISDQFAFRDHMLIAERRIFGQVGAPAPAPTTTGAETSPVAGGAETSSGAEKPPVRAVEGRHGRLFLTEGLLRSTGQEFDEARTRDYAGFVCEAASKARARGAKVVFGIAPGPAEIYPEDAPTWALPSKAPKEYDAVLAQIRHCGVPTADIREALLKAKPGQNLYRHTDTHWTQRGALIGFNALVTALGKPDWAPPKRTSTWASVTMSDGDLPRMMSQPPVAETLPILNLVGASPSPPQTVAGVKYRDTPPTVVVAARPGPTVLIIGDSYSDLFPSLLAQSVGRAAWVHEDDCGFDWKVLDVVKPDYVIIMPAERYAACPGGARPQHFN